VTPHVVAEIINGIGRRYRCVHELYEVTHRVGGACRAQASHLRHRRRKARQGFLADQAAAVRAGGIGRLTAPSIFAARRGVMSSCPGSE
jgi:hypothetical protein